MDVWNKKRRCWENTEDQKKITDFSNGGKHEERKKKK